MMRGGHFRWATVLQVWLLLQSPVLAAADSALLKPVAPHAAPGGDDRRLTQLLAQHKGKPVLVNFWATWCEPCREEMPALARLAARWQAKGLTVLTVAVADNDKRAADFLWEILPGKQTLPVLHDREQAISRAWGARVLPTTVVLDRRHRIVLRGQGAIDWDAPAIDQQLTKQIN
ncbi:MAG: TlpA disulfide reductase family protein [Sulfuritalea sp.]|nr:TlpA disulfide reductase family protein [Sulfuritalea sp.]MDP1984175.1 TlpA disulfide reductase family protein [Sulfuritalea sp.]